MDEATSIDAPEVIRIGDATTEVGSRLAGEARQIQGWAFAARDAVPGASTCFPAMSNAATAWQTTLATLAGEIEDFGRSLHRTAADYQRADADAARRARASGHPGPDWEPPR